MSFSTKIVSSACSSMRYRWPCFPVVPPWLRSGSRLGAKELHWEWQKHIHLSENADIIASVTVMWSGPERQSKKREKDAQERATEKLSGRAVRVCAWEAVSKWRLVLVCAWQMEGGLWGHVLPSTWAVLCVSEKWRDCTISPLSPSLPWWGEREGDCHSYSQSHILESNFPWNNKAFASVWVAVHVCLCRLWECACARLCWDEKVVLCTQQSRSEGKTIKRVCEDMRESVLRTESDIEWKWEGACIRWCACQQGRKRSYSQPSCMCLTSITSFNQEKYVCIQIKHKTPLLPGALLPCLFVLLQAAC